MHFFARHCEKIRQSAMSSRLLWPCLLLVVLLVLGIFKYTGFLLGNLQSLFGVPELIPARLASLSKDSAARPSSMVIWRTVCTTLSRFAVSIVLIP